MSFHNLLSLMQEVYIQENEKQTDNNLANVEHNILNERQKALIEILRKNNYWPTLQFKKFFSTPNLFLLYNSQKTNEFANTSCIYKECRSVILNLLAEKSEDSIVSSMYMDNPIRVLDTVYEKTYELEDVLEAGYEGTMIHTYWYQDNWFFSTTSCPTIDGSRYFHPTKTHGTMFDDCLRKLFPDIATNEENISKKLRDMFTSHLDKNKKYLFVLIHYENKHIIDYSGIYGEEYAKLVHIATYNKGLSTEPLDDKPLSSLGMLYPEKFASVEDGLTWLRSNKSMYAVIVKRPGSLLRVCRDHVIFQETTDLGNSNPWHNMLWIYLQNRPDVTVANYAMEKKISNVRMDNGKYLSPTFVIHSTISTIVSYLYKMYTLTTYYNSNSKEFSFKGHIDKTLPPIIRFHLVQLREIQKTIHSDKYLTQKTISHYIRFHQTMKNIRLLIQFFAKNQNMLHIFEETMCCIKQFNDLLVDH